MRQRFHRVPSWNDYQGPLTSQLTVVYPKMPNTSSFVNTRATLVNSRPSPSVGNAIRSQSLVNSRHHSSNTHTSAPAPAVPLPSRKSPKILQILFQPIPQSLVNSHDLSSNTHTSATAPAAPLPSRKSPKIMQILLQTIRPTLAHALVCSRRNSTHPHPPIPIPIPLSPPPSVSGKAASQAPPFVLTRPRPRRTNQEPNKIRLWLSCKTQQKTRKCVTSPIVMRDKRRMEQ